MSATVHNIHLEEMRVGDVYIGRRGHGFDGYWGNKNTSGTRTENIKAFEQDFYRSDDMCFRVRELVDKRLFCFCAPKPCHGDFLANIANNLIKCEQCNIYMIPKRVIEDENGTTVLLPVCPQCGAEDVEGESDNVFEWQGAENEYRS